MLIESVHKASKIDIGCLSSVFLSKHMLDLHDIFNQEVFQRHIEIPGEYASFCKLIYNAFGQDAPAVSRCNLDKRYACNGKNDVLLGFSAGLDSVYQAIALKERGYNVHLLFARNINTYENGQAWRYAEPIASKLGLDLMSFSMKKCLKKDPANLYRQHWPENPMKNQLILAIMMDMCLERGWAHVSLGDDFDLKLKDAVPGVNLTDAEEVTKSFLEASSRYIEGIDFIPISKGEDKSKRLKKMFSYGLKDLYYSCVQSGRFNKSLRKKMQDKFGVALLGNNCGCCRKCCMHNLLMHYSGMQKFPDAFVSHCWEKMHSTGCKADYEFFKPELPLEKRIENLFGY